MDLSTLTSIRLENRRAKQRLENALNDVSFLDESTQELSPVGMDSSFLGKENLRYLDKTQYDKDVKLNDIRRQRLLSSPRISPMRKPLRSMMTAVKETTNDSTRFDEILVNNRADTEQRRRGLRPGAGLSPPNLCSVSLSPVKREISTSPAKSHHLKDLDNKLEDNLDDDFDRIVQKYKLRTLNNDHRSPEERQPTEKIDAFQVHRLQRKIAQMEATIEQYKNSTCDGGLATKNSQLLKEVTKLNEFIKFMDSNFQEIYAVWQKERDEKERLIRKMQESKLQDVRTRNRLSPPKLSPLKRDLKATSPLKKVETVDDTEKLLFYNF